MFPCNPNPDSTGWRPHRDWAIVGLALLVCAIACGQTDFVHGALTTQALTTQALTTQALTTQALTTQAVTTDSEQLEKFLARLGLVDLRIQLLERSLQTSPTPESKLAMARRLADLYAERLMAHAEDVAAYNDTLQRIETLVQEVPEANTAPLQVMLLQADYNRAESLLTAWMNDPQAESSCAEAQQILDRISPSLLQFDTELNKQAESLLAQLDETPGRRRLHRAGTGSQTSAGNRGAGSLFRRLGQLLPRTPHAAPHPPRTPTCRLAPFSAASSVTMLRCPPIPTPKASDWSRSGGPAR